MFEEITYEGILAEMLGKAAELYPDLDTREGSLLYTALAPAAVEIVNLYIALDSVLDMSFPDTASREYLIRRCAERGIKPNSASQAVIAAECLPAGIHISTGTRFSCEGSTYVVTGERLGSYFLMKCEIAGAAGNRSGGTLLPLTYVEGLIAASVADLTFPGEDEEDTETLRAKYFDSFNSQAFGGNIKEYREKVNSISGVGGVKVYPAYMGGGTVKLVIIGGDFSVPSDTLIQLVQTVMDPVENSGKGLGLAPIGHAVTVTGVTAAPINIILGLTYADGWRWSDVEPYAKGIVDSYFLELSEGWADLDNIIVRKSILETRLLELEGVKDVSSVRLNGLLSNISLDDDEIPIRGTLNG